MYMSRVKIDTRLHSSRQALANLNRLHAMVAGCFDEVAEAQRPLWRIDTLGDSTYLLLVSSEVPNFDTLLHQISSNNDAETVVRDYDSFLSSLHDDEKLRFRITANPVHSVAWRDKDAGRGKVYGHVTVDQQKDWLVNRARKNGFALQSFDIVSRGVKKFQRQGKTVTLSVATYEGLLHVDDVETLRNALMNGVGRAKAYGCGLLTVAKI